MHMPYNFTYVINKFDTDTEYQQEFLNLFNIKNIDESTEQTFNELISLIENNEDWMTLLKKMSSQIPIHDDFKVTDSIIYLFSYTNIMMMHTCLQEYYLYKTTYAVKEFIKII